MRFKIFITAILLCGILSPFAADQVLNTKFVSGKVEMQKKGQGKWLAVRTGAKFRQMDRLRTYASSEAILSFENGSEVRVQENSILDMTELQTEGGNNATTLGVRRGNLLFNIKKLASKDQFKFETMTATAAIRGTAGGIGMSGDQTMAFLDEGALDLEPKNGGKSARIGPKEYAIQNIQGFDVKTWAGKMQMQQVFNKLVQDTNLKNLISDTSGKLKQLDTNQILSKLDSLVKKILVEDTLNTPKDTLKKNTEKKDTVFKNNKDSTLKATGGRLNDYESKTSDTKMNIKGACYGNALSVMAGEFQAPVMADGSWSLSLYWPLYPSGNKKYSVSCVYGNEKVEIGKLSIDYQAPVEEYSLNLKTPTQVRVTNGVLLLEGSYVGKDAVLRATFGQKSVDLTSVTGAFRQEIPITDQAGTWNLTKVDLQLSGPQGSIAQSIDLDVDKTSARVNTLAPSLIAKEDLLKGVILLSLSQVSEDPCEVSVFVDNEERSTLQVQSDIQNKGIPLEVGAHQYRVMAVDQAANKRQIDLGLLEFWQRTDFYLDVSLKNLDQSTVKLPPLPPGMNQSSVTDQIHIEIKGLPEDNPQYIEEIQIINQSNGFRKVLRATELKDVRYDLDLTLDINKTNNLLVRVIPKSGLQKEWTKSVLIQR